MKNRLSVMDTYEVERDGMTDAACWQAYDNRCLPHFHQSIELVFIESGKLTARIDGKTVHAEKNQILISSSYAVHTYMTEEPNEEVVMIIPLASVPSLQKRLQKKVFCKEVWDVVEGGREELAVLLPMAANHWAEYGPETRKGISYMVLGMLIDGVGLEEQPHGDHQNGAQDILKEALSYLQEHYQQPLKLEDVAKHFGYGKSRFSRLFHDSLGCSMNEYLMALRCRHAAELLLNSEMTMLDIALNVGFECLRTFYRAFHSCYQCTPSQYVKAHT